MQRIITASLMTMTRLCPSTEVSILSDLIDFFGCVACPLLDVSENQAATGVSGWLLLECIAIVISV